MKKHICGLLPVFLLLFGCGDSVQELPVQKPGMGRVIIGQSESQKRTILPQTPEFVSYLLSFQYQGEGEAEQENLQTDTLPCSVELTPGSWLITVTAYTLIEGIPELTDGNYPAASGSITVTVNSGTIVPVTVNLISGTFIEGQGVLEYEIGLPAETGGAVLRVLDMDKSETVLINLLESASGSIALDAGYYLLQVQVATGRARSKTELLHIYSGHTTRVAGSGWNFNIENGVYLSVAELSEFLAAAPANTADTPYPVKLNVNLQSLASTISSTDNHVVVLGALFNALHGKYATVDLSNASGNMGTAPYDNYYSAAPTDADKLVSVILPDSLTIIRPRTFQNCSSLKSFVFPHSLQKIGYSAFAGCSSLISADLSDCLSLTTITDLDNTNGNTFSNCSSLEEVKLPDSVQIIGGFAFANCEKLEEMIFPSSLQTVGGYAFQDSGITKADFSSCSNFQEFVWVGIFLRCVNLREVILPTAVTSLNVSMFSGCTSLESIELPALLGTIEGRAFYGCTLLTMIDLSETVVPPSLIQDGAGRTEWFEGTPANLVIYVPASSVTAYKTAANWSTFASKIQAKP
jgi:hypothetical protein